MWNSKSNRIAALIFLLLYLSIFTDAKALEYVAVRDAYNPACSLINAGSVNYDFEISSTEVTNREYCDFLNSVARYSDPFALYSPLMEIHFWGGIIKHVNEKGIYSYNCKEGYCNYPVVFVSWCDAVRFINWLHFGKPNKGSETLGTTEGNAINGAYNTHELCSNNFNASISLKGRNMSAVYWLPNRDEWIKAGFYDGKGHYYQYATQTNSMPVSVPPSEKVGNAANYYANRWALPYPHLSEVGSYVDAKSFYKTHDQAGNVMEWVEDFLGGNRMALGGSLFMNEYSLPITYWDGENPHAKLSTFGFRVARKMNARLISFPGKMDAVTNVSDALNAPERKESPIDFQEMPFVKVGDSSNLSDYNRYGSVDYEYYIGKYEISNEQYVEFLNAVASSDDPYSLYCDSMDQGVLGGILRRGQKGAFQYVVKDGWGKRPVVYVSWFDIARFANWHHFGKPRKGVSELGTTEGNATLGAYDTTGFENIALVKARASFTRNKGAMYFIPNENEWYKAAYYDPEKMGFRKYWDFPVKTDNSPNNKKPPGDFYTINYQVGSTFSEGPPFYLSEINAYPKAQSYYGTNCQGGNVWEWLENWRELTGKQTWRGTENVKAVRGGSFGYTEIGLHVSNTDPADPRHETYVHGARLARAIDKSGYQPKTRGLYSTFVTFRNKLSQKKIFVIDAFIGFVGGIFFSFLAVGFYMKTCRKQP